MQSKNVDYIQRESCPLCKEPIRLISNNKIKSLAVEKYFFGGNFIPAFGLRRTGIVTCSECGLVFKDQVPTIESLTRLFSESVGTAWSRLFDFTEELKFAITFCKKKDAAILDIGSSNGSLPRKFLEYYSYVSALDIVLNPVCDKKLTGEYIQGLLDDSNLEWSGKLYDLVTVFDVVEHLYDVSQGMKNLNQLLTDGGHVIIETGDVESKYPRRFGTEKWWYLNLIEHHQAFSEQALVNAAERAGFSIVSIKRKRHKYKRALSWNRLVRRATKVLLYHISFGLYSIIFKNNRQPAPPFDSDHFLVVLKKTGSL